MANGLNLIPWNLARLLFKKNSGADFRFRGKGYNDWLVMSVMNVREEWKDICAMHLPSLIKQRRLRHWVSVKMRVRLISEDVAILANSWDLDSCLSFWSCFWFLAVCLLTRGQWWRAPPHLQGVSCRIRMCKINLQNQRPKPMLEIVSHLRSSFFYKGMGVGFKGMMSKANLEDLDHNKAQSVLKNSQIGE